MAEEISRLERDQIYQRGYSKGYAARGRRFETINRDEVARRVQAVFAATGPAKTQANFDLPSGRRITLLMPPDMTGEDLDFFREVAEPYLELLGKRLKEKEASPVAAEPAKTGGA